MKQSVKVLAIAAGVAVVAAGLAAFAVVAQPDATHTDREFVPFTASNGLSSQYHVYAAGVPQPAGLLIWAHGDGAYEFTHPESPYAMGGSDGVRAVAKAHGYILVSALSPDASGTWWENGEDNADYFADLIAQLEQEYDTDAHEVVLAGYSGGAQFITQYFLPEFSGRLDGGGAVVFGGGGPPETEQQQPWNEQLKSNFFMYWATGELDTAANSDEDYDALGYADDGQAYYAALGFEKSSFWIPGKTHALDGMFGDLLAAALAGRQPRSG